MGAFVTFIDKHSGKYLEKKLSHAGLKFNYHYIILENLWNGYSFLKGKPFPWVY